MSYYDLFKPKYTIFGINVENLNLEMTPNNTIKTIIPSSNINNNNNTSISASESSEVTTNFILANDGTFISIHQS